MKKRFLIFLSVQVLSLVSAQEILGASEDTQEILEKRLRYLEKNVSILVRRFQIYDDEFRRIANRIHPLITDVEALKKDRRGKSWDVSEESDFTDSEESDSEWQLHNLRPHIHDLFAIHENLGKIFQCLPEMKQDDEVYRSKLGNLIKKQGDILRIMVTGVALLESQERRSSGEICNPLLPECLPSTSECTPPIPERTPPAPVFSPPLHMPSASKCGLHGLSLNEASTFDRQASRQSPPGPLLPHAREADKHDRLSYSEQEF